MDQVAQKHPIGRAMAFLHVVLLLVLSTCASAEFSDGSRPYISLFDAMVLLILVLMLVVVFLLGQLRGFSAPGKKPAMMEKGSDHKSFVSTVDKDGQCELVQSASLPDGKIYVTASGSRWHLKEDCRHLKAANKVIPLTPCQACCR